MDLTVEMSIFVHNVYVFCLTNSVMYFVNLSAGKLVKLNHRKESTAVLNELAPFVCFTFMDLAEIAALFFCFYDVIHEHPLFSSARITATPSRVTDRTVPK